jgi:hypothetical protein
MFKTLLYLFPMFLSSLFSCQSSTDIESVSPTAFSKIIDTDPSIVRLDVRTPAEYAEGHIAGSLNVDVTSPDFVQRVQQQVPKGKTIALYCRSGRRSKMAAAQLLKQGYKIIELESGILGWMSQQLPVSKD